MAKKLSRIRRTFTPQFKKDAVALIAGGRSVNEVAHDLGIARSLLQRWKTQFAREPGVSAAFPGTGRLAPQAEQLRQLQQRLRTVTEERDILKKSLGVLRGRPEVKFHFIAAHRAEFRVRSLCRCWASPRVASPPGPDARRPARPRAMTPYSCTSGPRTRPAGGPTGRRASTRSSGRKASRPAGTASPASCVARGSSPAPSAASGGPPPHELNCPPRRITCGATSPRRRPLSAGSRTSRRSARANSRGSSGRGS